LTHHRLVDDVRIVDQGQLHPICATPLSEGFFTMKTAMQFLLFMLIAVLDAQDERARSLKES
jgi:hypothetical protein